MVQASAALESPISTQQLESAIERAEFELYYQPLINTSDASLYGVEALIRWNHPESGLLRPADFIPLAEESGLIVELGSWVLRRACDDFHLFEPFNENLLLSVNVSSRQLDEPSFILELADILEQTAMPAHLLQLEITESIFLLDSMRVGALFMAIRALGVKIAFDDFGTGYSSLSYLERYPVDMLKVDRYFVQRMSEGHVSTEIVQLIVHLAQSVGIGVAAEGVEKHEQAATLSSLGCNIAQGFLYSEPIPLRAITALLADALACSSLTNGKNGRSAPCWIPPVSRYAMS